MNYLDPSYIKQVFPRAGSILQQPGTSLKENSSENLMASGPAGINPTVKIVLDRHSHPLATRYLKIDYSTLSKDSGETGALQLALENVFIIGELLPAHLRQAPEARFTEQLAA